MILSKIKLIIGQFYPPSQSLKKIYLFLTKNVYCYKGVKITNTEFKGGFNVLYSKVIIGNSSIGLGSYISSGSVINKTKIGKYSSIGSNVKTIGGNHPVEHFVSTHPAFYSLQKQSGFTFVDKQIFLEHKYCDSDNKYSFIIGNDVWIGSNVLILEGVKIGDGAVVAAGSLVIRDVEPYEIVAGVPAIVIRKRFNERQISFLKNFCWWDKDSKWLQNNSHSFKNISEFIDSNKN